MSNNKNLHVYKDEKVLEVTLRWYKPVAYFTAIFSLFWMGFLAIWYAMALSGPAPGVALVLPLLHVGAGFAMIYYTLCLFLNKTYIDIDDGFLTVHHAPIPWWKGNKTIPIEEVEQLFVKEKITKGENSTTRTYSLLVKLKSGLTRVLMDISHASSEQMQEIETELEAYLGIEDEPVETEYKGGSKRRKRKEYRRKNDLQLSDHALGPVYSATVESAINIENTSWQITSITQYDWKDGNSDKLFQLSDGAIAEYYLFIRQIQGLLYAFKEKTMNPAIAQSLLFNPETPSEFFKLKGMGYNLARDLKGKKYISGIQGAIEVREWLYTAEDNQSQIRILDAGGVLSYEYGERVHPNKITFGLDLNSPPQKQQSIQERRWDEEDLV